MKFNRLFVIGVLAFLALVFMVEYRIPPKFQWTPTFSHSDKQPFGCYVFDSVLKASLPQGYSVVNKTFYQMKDDTATRKAILMVADDVYFTDTDVATILKMVERGNRILLASESLEELADTLDLFTTYEYNDMSIMQHARKGLGRDTIVWLRDSLFDERDFMVYPQLLNWTICGSVDTIDFRLPDNCRALSGLDSHGTDHATAVSIPVGEGEIIWASTPLLFTNYGILDRDNYLYVFRLLSQLGRLPVVRTEAYNPKAEDEAEQTPLRYILSQPPLRWALYLTLLTLLLFMVFTARRRQRVIPVIKAPENRSLEFVRHIGTLYALRKDYRDIVLKKYAYFAEELRRVLHIDLTDASADDRHLQRLFEQTGIERQKLEELVHGLRRLAAQEGQISEDEMTRYLRQMNEVIKMI